MLVIAAVVQCDTDWRVRQIGPAARHDDICTEMQTLMVEMIQDRTETS